MNKTYSISIWRGDGGTADYSCPVEFGGLEFMTLEAAKTAMDDGMILPHDLKGKYMVELLEISPPLDTGEGDLIKVVRTITCRDIGF